MVVCLNLNLRLGWCVFEFELEFELVCFVFCVVFIMLISSMIRCVSIFAPVALCERESKDQRTDRLSRDACSLQFPVLNRTLSALSALSCNSLVQSS